MDEYRLCARPCGGAAPTGVGGGGCRGNAGRLAQRPPRSSSGGGGEEQIVPPDVFTVPRWLKRVCVFFLPVNFQRMEADICRFSAEFLDIFSD